MNKEAIFFLFFVCMYGVSVWRLCMVGLEYGMQVEDLTFFNCLIGLCLWFLKSEL